mgnify:CR=1 FL=1|tara:strand:+ start:6608 stop:6979 length:372 start_codon:yes stop_codon:yes gene_type:complete
MHPKLGLYLTLLLCLLSVNVYAEYKTSGQMTQEEYQKVSESSAEYNECLNEFAMSQLQSQPDARVIADHAMKECASHLEGLYNFLLSGNYPPEAMKRFVGSISNKSANKLLSNLMRYKASQSQ